jgi:hypothetical protein
VLDAIQISARVNFALPLPKPNDTDRQKMEPTGKKWRYIKNILMSDLPYDQAHSYVV